MLAVLVQVKFSMAYFVSATFWGSSMVDLARFVDAMQHVGVCVFGIRCEGFDLGLLLFLCELSVWGF